MGLAPSGHAIDIAVMDLFRIVDGRLVEHWALLGPRARRTFSA
jgi:predicted SnoaL-like aldol condensation-catalyzing enzyme